MEKFNKIEGGIPNDDVSEWMKALREADFSSEEIDLILERANKDYFKANHPNFIEEELEKIKKEYWDKYKRALNKEEIEYFRKGLEIRLKEK